MPETSQARFVPDMTVEQVLAAHPKARWVLAAWHLGGCSTCGVSAEETLEQVADGYGLPIEKLLADLNSLVA